MTKKGQLARYPKEYAKFLIVNDLVRPYHESPKAQVVRKPEVGFEPNWNELRKEAMEKGVFKVGMNKEAVKKALDDLRK